MWKCDNFWNLLFNEYLRVNTKESGDRNSRENMSVFDILEWNNSAKNKAFGLIGSFLSYMQNFGCNFLLCERFLYKVGFIYGLDEQELFILRKHIIENGDTYTVNIYRHKFY